MHAFDRLVMSSAGQRLAAAQDSLETDGDVLNFALTLEHLTAAFYALAGDFDLGTDPFGNSINDYMELAGQQEVTHAATLTDVITQLGGEPVLATGYDFGVTDSASFLATAAGLEELGVAAYNGLGANLQDPMLLEMVGTIIATEARHAAYANLVIGDEPYPDAYETPATADEVLEAIDAYIIQ